MYGACLWADSVPIFSARNNYWTNSSYSALVQTKLEKPTIILIHKKWEINDHRHYDYKPINLLSDRYEWFTEALTGHTSIIQDLKQPREQVKSEAAYQQQTTYM